jgi:hypothetical protein
MLLQSTKPDRKQSNAEDGYLLLTVLVMIFLLPLALLWSRRRWRRRFSGTRSRRLCSADCSTGARSSFTTRSSARIQATSSSWKTNEIRFLRKRYKDPITGQDDWRLIHMGEAKVPPMGFFGSRCKQA